MPNNRFDSILQSKLKDIDTSPSADVWSKIEQELGTNTQASFWNTKKTIGSLALVSFLALSTCYFIYTPNVNKTTNSTAQVHKIEKSSPVLKEQNNTITETSAIEYSNKPTTVPIRKKEIFNTPFVAPNKIQNNIAEIFVEKTENEVMTFKEQREPKSISPPTKKENKTPLDKTYQAGEVVKVEFEFQNVSGFASKKVESWVEFPDWVDVSTVETTSQSNGILVKTIKKEKYNTVVWIAEGNFASNLNSIESKGTIEYRFVIKESKKQSDINKLKPELK